MKKTTYLKTLLVALCLLGGVNSVWGATIIGNTSNSWTASGSYLTGEVLSAGKMRTFTFTVDALGTDWWASYVVDLTKTNAVAENSDNAYLFLRSCLFDYHVGAAGDWNVGALYNKHTFGETTINTVLEGATVVLNVRRFDTYAIIQSDITTTSSAKYHHYYVQDLETTEDVYLFLCADEAQLTISDDQTEETTISNPIEAILGDNTNFLTGMAKTLGPDETVNYNFKNENATTGDSWLTWGVELIYNNGSNIYFDINVGDLNPWGEIFTSAKTKELTKSSNWPTSNIKTSLNGADVTLTVARNGRIVTITAVNTPTSGDPFTFKYTLEPSTTYTSFEESDITVKLIARSCTVTNYYPIQKINTEISQYGYASFSSTYAHDFTDVDGLEAYIANECDGTTVSMQEVTGTVAANTGLILKGDAGIYSIPMVDSGDSQSGNLLFACDGSWSEVTPAYTGTNFVLSVQNDKVVFAPVLNDNAPISAGQAALWADVTISEARALNMVFEDETTDISKARVTGASVAAKQGKHVENGKLVIIKNGKKYNTAGLLVY